MNTRSAVWLISILSVFAILMTVLFSVIGCESEDKTDDESTLDAIDAVGTPAVSDSGADPEGSVYYPNTSVTVNTDPSIGATDTNGSILTDATDSPETEISKEPELSSIRIKGSYSPSDARIDDLYAAILGFGRPVGFTAVDINTGVSISYNADQKFSPASIIKASVVYYACKQIDAGKASLDEKLTYTSADVVHGNGVIGKSGVGTVYTLREVIYHTVNTSDNEGYYMLLRRFGRNGHDDLVRSLGCSSGLVKTSRWPRVTASDFARVWQAIYDYRNESTTGKWLYELFLNVKQMHFFRDALGVETANKAGWNADNYNDSGIIYGDRTYILVLLTDGSYYTAKNEDYNAIVRAIDAMMSEYATVADPMPETERFEEDLPEPLPYEPPAETEPPETDPVETDTAETAPIETEPVETDTDVTEPIETDPIETDPIVTEPITTEPVTTEPTDTGSDLDQTVTDTEPVTDESVSDETEPMEDTGIANA